MKHKIQFCSSVSKKKSGNCDSYQLDRHRRCRPSKTLKHIKDINTKLGILDHHHEMQLQDNVHKSESHMFGVMRLVC